MEYDTSASLGSGATILLCIATIAHLLNAIQFPNEQARYAAVYILLSGLPGGQEGTLETAVQWLHSEAAVVPWYTHHTHCDTIVKGRASCENVFTPLFLPPSLALTPFAHFLLYTTFLKSFLSIKLSQSIMIFIST